MHVKDDTVRLAICWWIVQNGNEDKVKEGRRIIGDGGILGLRRWAGGIDDDGGRVPLSSFVFWLCAPPQNHTCLEDDTIHLAMLWWGVKDIDDNGVVEGRRIVGNGGTPSLWSWSGSIDDNGSCVSLSGLVFLLCAPPRNHTKSGVGLQGSFWEKTSPDQPCRPPPPVAKAANPTINQKPKI